MILEVEQWEAELLLKLANKKGANLPWSLYVKLLAAAGKSIRSSLHETPAKQHDEAPTGLEPVFQSAELKADTRNRSISRENG